MRLKIKESWCQSVTEMCAYVPLLWTRWLFSCYGEVYWKISGCGLPTAVRESGQQGQSTTALACLYLPKSSSQSESKTCLCSYEGIFSMKQKATVFILMSGQGESHSEKVDICAYSPSSSRMRSPPPQSMKRLSGHTIDFNGPIVSKRCRIHTQTHTQTYTHPCAWKVVLLSISKQCKPIFSCALSGFHLI